MRRVNGYVIVIGRKREREREKGFIGKEYVGSVKFRVSDDVVVWQWWKCGMVVNQMNKLNRIALIDNWCHQP